MSSLLCWNVRGFNKTQKQEDVASLVSKNKFDLVGLIDTRISEENMQMVLNRCLQGWKIIHNYAYNSAGKVWLCWRDSIGTVRCIDKGDQHITVEVTKFNGQIFLLTVVYASNDPVQRRRLWDVLVSFSSTVMHLWMVTSDFNSVLNAQERIGGGGLKNYQFADLFDCVNMAGSSYMRYRGHEFTWSNKQESRIMSKLDRVLVNSDWLITYSDFEAEFGNAGVISDHSYIKVSSFLQKEDRKKSFKFFNFWIKEDGFMNILEDAWKSGVHGNPMYVLVAKLKLVKKALIMWSRKKVGNVAARSKQLKEKLDVVRTCLQKDPLNVIYVADERKLLQEYMHAAEAEEKAMKQKSRDLAVTDGDNNTEHFFRLI